MKTEVRVLTRIVDSRSARMEFLQMFGELRRTEVWQGLDVVKKMIKHGTEFCGCAKASGQSVQCQHKPLSATSLNGSGNFWIPERAASIRQERQAFAC